LVLVSILIPSYNYARYLAAALDSALSQTHREVEVIVVDDGSTDESAAIIGSYGDRVRSVQKENGGPVSALNVAFERSHGELICFLDADDVFEPDKVERVVAAARDMPDAYLIGHQLQAMDSDGRPTHPPFPRRVPNGDLRDRVIRGGGWFFHAVSSGLAFRRSFAERLFPIPTECVVRIGTETHRIMTEGDTYLAGPAALLAPVAGIQAPLARYREHGANRTADVPAREAMRRYEAEVAALADVMRLKFGQSVDLKMENHLQYQLHRCAAGEISRRRAAARVMRSASLPLALRMRETLRVAANRGASARPSSRSTSSAGPAPYSAAPPS
jgi:glycosyltransferase involved in cell wall biosynthesis